MVFSTLHTNDAPSAFTRLIDMKVEPFLVASTVEGVLAQRLVRRICSHCKEMYQPELSELPPGFADGDQPIDAQRSGGRKISPSYAAGTGRTSTLAPPVELSRGAGCRECRNTGYRGRIGIYELFVPDDECYDLISNGATLNGLKGMANKRGMTTLRADGIEKVKAGITTLEEVYRVTA